MLTVAMPVRQYRFGNEVARWFRKILPEHVAAIAAASCKITIEGKESIGNEWGTGYKLQMQTFNTVPRGFKTVSFDRHANVISAHNRESCDKILNLFGLTIDELLAAFGTPPDGEKYTITLMQALQTLQGKSQDSEFRNLAWGE